MLVQAADHAFGNRAGSIVSSQTLPAGKAQIVLDFTPDESTVKKEMLPGRSMGPGVARLSINGQPAGESPITNFGGYYYETFDIGSDLGTPVSSNYASPFSFTDNIDAVTVELR